MNVLVRDCTGLHMILTLGSRILRDKRHTQYLHYFFDERRKNDRSKTATRRHKRKRTLLQSRHAREVGFWKH